MKKILFLLLLFIYFSAIAQDSIITNRGKISTISNLKFLGNVSGSATVPNQLFYSWYNVKDFPGIVDDSITDCTAGLRALIAALPDGSTGASGATLYFPGGGKGYLFSDSILITKNINFLGDGRGTFQFYTILVNKQSRGATNLYFNSSSKNFFVFLNSATNKSPACFMEKMSLINTNATPTAGNAILIDSNITQFTIRDCMLNGFYNNFNVKAAVCVNADNCSFVAPVAWNMILGNHVSPDAGGFWIRNSLFESGLRNLSTCSGIYFKGGGAVKLTNLDFNSQGNLDTTKEMVYCFYADFSDGATTDIQIANWLAENYKTNAIKIINRSGGAVGNIQINQVQCGPYNAATKSAIDISGCNNVTVQNIIGSNISSVAFPFIKLDSISGLTLVPANKTVYWNADYSITNSTSVRVAALVNQSISGSLSTDNFLNVTETFPATTTTNAQGVFFDITGAGSVANTQIAFNASLEAGYTGVASTQGISANNYSLGTGNTIGGAANTGGNSGAANSARGATTTGANFGSYNWATAGLRNVGSIGDATTGQFNSSSALSGGVIGFGLRNNSSAIEFGGYFGLQATQPTFASAAIIADNGAESVPIALFRDNGTIKDQISDGGNVGIGTTTTNALLQLGAGTTAANTAPLKFTSGSLTTTPEIGAMQFQSGLWYIDSSNTVRDTIAGRGWVRANITGGGGAVSSVSNSDGTLTISPTTGGVVASIALGHANTWTAVQTIGSATNINFPATSGTDRSSSLLNINSGVDEIAGLGVYPSGAGSNIAPSIIISPKGTGFSTAISSQILFSATDYVASNINYDGLLIRSSTLNGGTINMTNGGTGTIRKLTLSTGANSTQLVLNTDGTSTFGAGVGIGANPPDASYRLYMSGTNTATLRATLNNTSNNSGAFTAYSLLNDNAVTSSLFLNSSTNTLYGGASSLNVYAAGSTAFGINTNNTLRWSVTGSGNFTAGTDNSFDIGQSGALRPRTLYLGTDANIAGNLNLGTAGSKLTITEGTNGRTGQTTLVAGTKAITISGLTTSSRAFIQGVSQGGTVSTTFEYAAVCTSNTLTITALTTGNVTNNLDTSTLNYFILN